MTYETIIRGKWMFDGCKTIDEMRDRLVEQVNFFTKLKEAGAEVTCEEDGIVDDYAFLTLETENEKLADDLGFILSEEE